MPRPTGIANVYGPSSTSSWETAVYLKFSERLSRAYCDWWLEAERAKAVLEALPADVEDTISRLEKKSKGMEKNSNSAASKQKMLKGLLERL